MNLGYVGVACSVDDVKRFRNVQYNHDCPLMWSMGVDTILDLVRDLLQGAERTKWFSEASTGSISFSSSLAPEIVAILACMSYLGYWLF